jgi:ParB family chromosome partitioning protein
LEILLSMKLRPVERARAFRSMMTLLGLNQLELSKRLNLSVGTISESLSLLALPQSIQAMVERGDLAPSAAAALKCLDDTAVQERLATEAVAAGLTRSELKAAIASHVGGRGAKPSEPKRRRVEFFLPEGEVVTVSVPDPEATDAAIEAALKLALARFRLGRKTGG